MGAAEPDARHLRPLRQGRVMTRDQRQELVGYLAGEGMSTRAIAPIVGTTHSTVVRDLAGGANAPGVLASPEPPPFVDTETGELHDTAPEPAPESKRTATEALSHALLAATSPVPCRGTDAHLWTSDEQADRREAAQACQGCPAAVQAAGWTCPEPHDQPTDHRRDRDGATRK